MHGQSRTWLLTCVVGVRSTSGVLLAADSQFSGYNMNRMVKDPKVFSLFDTLAVAYCGSGRLGQILMYQMTELEEPQLGLDEHYWAVKIFVECLREVLDSLGHLHVDSIGGDAGVEHLGGSAFLLAVRGRLFCVQADFDVLEHRAVFDALGSGEEVAMGAMAAAIGDADSTEPVTDSASERIATAGIEAASEFTNYVGGDLVCASTVTYSVEERELARKILKR